MRNIIIASVLALSVAVPAVAQVPTSAPDVSAKLNEIHATLRLQYALQSKQYLAQVQLLEALQQLRPTTASTGPSCDYAGTAYSVGAARDGQICGYVQGPSGRHPEWSANGLRDALHQ